MDTLPDIQACEPDYPINLTRVGVTGVKKLVKVERGNDERPVILISDFEVFVDLPSDRKGANLSRNFEVIDEVLEEAINCPVYEIEELCGEIAKRLLHRHEYASQAEVKMKSEYIVRRLTPVTKVTCQEVVDIFAEAVAKAGPSGYLKKTVGAEVLGTTACPCAQEIMKEQVQKELAKLGVSKESAIEFSERMPIATHNQRGRGSISVEVHDRRCVSIDRIIKIIEESMSSKVFGLLKRPDEAIVVAKAHSNPKFVEDCVRTMAQKVVEAFSDLPDDAAVTLKQINEESIHQHNAFAERTAKMGELRSELANIKDGQ
ncbi:MAG: GTP cyclohydrolase I FolE2 [Methanothrix sp.]|nr:GTP cyclohydrolase I FolE2 [Methanothrix sp.]